MNETLWMGSDLSLSDYLNSLKTVELLQASHEPAHMQARIDFESPEKAPYLLEMQGSIAFININGPITNRNDWISAYLGMTSYNAIREALVTAAEDKYCEAIVLNISSPGGAVAGLDDVAKLVPQVDRIKPVYAYGSGSIASAAYWLASGAREIYAGVTSMIGSIGIMTKHRELTKMMEIQGITEVNIRGGKYKALAQDNERLSAEAQAQIQGHVDYMYGIFLDHVSAQRGKTATEMHETAADGREFIGSQAVTVGLIDGVMSYDAFVGMISDKILDNKDASGNTASKSTRTNFGDPTMGKKALTEAQVTALTKAGIDSDKATPKEIHASLSEVGLDTAETKAAAEAEVKEPEAKVTEQAKVESGNDGLTAYLQGELVAVRGELKDVTTELATLKASSGDLALLDQYKAIAIASCSAMTVALGGTATDLTEMAASAVLAHHEKLRGEYTTKFKAGGVAAIDAAVVESEAGKTPLAKDPKFAARVRAAGGKVPA